MYVRAPSFDPGANFYPLPGKCQGPPLDLSIFRNDAGYAFDFNGASKVQAKGAVVFRGAYAGEGDNPGWQPPAGVKPPPPPRAASIPQLLWIAPESMRAGASTLDPDGSRFRPERDRKRRRRRHQNRECDRE